MKGMTGGAFPPRASPHVVLVSSRGGELPSTIQRGGPTGLARRGAGYPEDNRGRLLKGPLGYANIGRRAGRQATAHITPEDPD